MTRNNVGQYPYSFSTADFDGDGKTDIVYFTSATTHLMFSRGDGKFAVTGPGAQSMYCNFSRYCPAVTGDFDGDGVPDILGTPSNGGLYLLRPERYATVLGLLKSAVLVGTGTHSITATYGGDSVFLPSSSAAVSLAAAVMSTTLQVAPSASSTTSGTQIVLTATLAPYSSGSISTNGQAITFLNNGTSIGTSTLTSGVATLNTTSLPAGSNSITATYAGDTNFSASTAAAVSVSVVTPQITVSPSSLTFSMATAGSTSAAQTITLTNSGQVATTISSMAASRRLRTNQHLRNIGSRGSKLHHLRHLQTYGSGFENWHVDHHRQRCGFASHRRPFGDRRAI